jgi:hypothetical protein
VNLPCTASAFLIGLVVASVASSQDNRASFIERARAATAKYQDQTIAVIDGYRRIGADFPAMGEHWIRIGLLFDGKIEPEHPEFLTYVNVDGVPKLMGIAYALPLLGDEKPPEIPAPAAAWHDHFRTLDDETILPLHHVVGSAEEAPRIAMLHVWLWSPNPDGIFAADNWSIPYIRAGVTVPSDASRAAACAFALTQHGFEFFMDTIEAVVSPDQRHRTRIAAALERARLAADRAVHDGQLDRLGSIWDELCRNLQSTIPSKSWNKLRTVLPAFEERMRRR